MKLPPLRLRSKCRYCGQYFEAEHEDGSVASVALFDLLQMHEQACPEFKPERVWRDCCMTLRGTDHTAECYARTADTPVTPEPIR